MESEQFNTCNNQIILLIISYNYSSLCNSVSPLCISVLKNCVTKWHSESVTRRFVSSVEVEANKKAMLFRHGSLS